MQRRSLPTFSILAMGLALGVWTAPSLAASPDTAPADLTKLLADLQTASNQQSLDQVMAFYGDGFTSTSGFDRKSLETNLQSFWQQYANLNYQVELLDWTPIDGGYEIETMTRVTGVAVRPERRLSLSAEVRSEQRISDGQITYQDILSEHSQLVSGNNPPTLTVLLPDQVAPGESYEFDAIVNEPLDGRSLLGVATDEAVTADDFFSPRPLSLDVLSSGGLYKVGQAPDHPDKRWISAVIVREDGMVIDSRQLTVTDTANTNP